MSLARVVDAFSNRLATAMVDPPPNIGGSRPASSGDLPAVTLSIRSVEQKMIAIGAKPAPSRTGNLSVGQGFDLSNPAITFPDGETVDLLSIDRRSLHFPYGPVVAADGTEKPALAAGDMSVSIDGTPLAVVPPDPGPGQVSGIPELGEIRFGVPVPAVGALRVDFFIGEWEVETARYQGELIIETVAEDPISAADLSVDVETTLLATDAVRLAGLRALHPLSFGPIVAHPSIAQGRMRELVYAFDFEFEEPKLGTGGGVIGSVAVRSEAEILQIVDGAETPDFGTEVFDVPIPTP